MAILTALAATAASASACRSQPPLSHRKQPPPGVSRTNLEVPPDEDVKLAAIEVPEGMVHVPQGGFRMGCAESADGPCATTEQPARNVWVSGFFMDLTEVTTAAFAACIKAGSCQPTVAAGECNGGQKDRDSFPVNCVTWDQAAQYCLWLHKRLPTEAEWEKAARGTDGRLYPWGSQAPDAGGIFRANWGEGLARALWVRDQWEFDGPVGFYPEAAGPYGTMDQAGNLSEWVADGYREGYDPDDTRDPSVGPTKDGRVVRGGSFREYARRLRTYCRDWHEPLFWYGHVGFRCARDAAR
jgi:formylglycine-generating enzyme required for sulfatase activity